MEQTELVLKEKLIKISSLQLKSGLFSKKNIAAGLIVVLLCVFYGSFLAHKINLTTADLGRHIRNGELALSGHFREATSQNTYSYTYPNHPVVNHHWGSGVVFYLLWKAGGFFAVQLFFILISLATFLIFFFIAKKKAGLGIAALVSIITIPLLAERTEIRPEVFSYFFAAVFLWILSRSPSPSPSHQGRGNIALVLLPILQILWVNTHIYFFLGPVIIGIFLIKDVAETFRSPSRESLKTSVTLFIFTCLATFINPFGLKAVIEPFTILKDYGYTIIENQPVWFIEKLIRNPNFLIFKIVFAILVISFAVRIFRRRSVAISSLLFAIGFSAMTWLQIRNFALFGFFAIPIIAGNFASSPSPPLEERAGVRRPEKFALGTLLIILVTILSGNLNHVFPYWKEFGLGLEKDNSKAGEFFKTNKIAGPIFNNYDNGGYLIYHLYPQEKVYVDNRPEAYPTKFFKEEYIDPQQDDNEWKKLNQKYNFNSIFFSYHDATPWGQNFLINRIRDTQWVPVYLDNYSIIMLRDNDQNREIINQFRIPNDRFTIKRQKPS